jgi:hypothetical protein
MLSSTKTPCGHQERLQLHLTETGIPKSKHADWTKTATLWKRGLHLVESLHSTSEILSKTDKDSFKIKTCFLFVQTDFALRLALPFQVCKVEGAQTHLLYHRVQRHMTRMSDEHRWTWKACRIREPLRVHSSSSVEHVPMYHVFLGPSMNS